MAGFQLGPRRSKINSCLFWSIVGSPLENLLHYLSKDVPPKGINMIAERKSFIENYSDAKNNIWTKAKDFLTNGDDIN